MQNQDVDQEQDNQIDSDRTVNENYRSSYVRWIALLLACLLLIGVYFSSDFPGFLKNFIIQDVLSEYPEEGQQIRFNLLYSVEALPNIVLPLIGGIMIDIIGIQTGILIFSGTLVIGQGFCLYGGIKNSFLWLLFGRFIFGLGSGSLGVAQNTIVSQWFFGKELSFSLGTNITIARLASVAAAFILIPLYKIQNTLFWPLLFCFLVCIFSFLCGCILVWIDQKADEQEAIRSVSIKLSNEEEKIGFSDLKQFSFVFYLLSLSCLVNYCCIFTFLANIQDLLVSYYNITETQANHFTSIPYIMGAILAPMIGLLIDNVGKRGIFLIMSSIFLVASHTLFFVYKPCPDQSCNYKNQIGIPLMFLGLFYSFFSAVFWPCIAIVTQQTNLGTAYGFTGSVQSLGLTFVPLLVSFIIGQGTLEDFRKMQKFFVILSILGLIINTLVFIVDLYQTRVLNMNSQQNHEYLLQINRLYEKDE